MGFSTLNKESENSLYRRLKTQWTSLERLVTLSRVIYWLVGAYWCNYTRSLQAQLLHTVNSQSLQRSWIGFESSIKLLFIIYYMECTFEFSLMFMTFKILNSWIKYKFLTVWNCRSVASFADDNRGTHRWLSCGYVTEERIPDNHWGSKTF